MTELSSESIVKQIPKTDDEYFHEMQDIKRLFLVFICWFPIL